MKRLGTLIIAALLAMTINIGASPAEEQTLAWLCWDELGSCAWMALDCSEIGMEHRKPIYENGDPNKKITCYQYHYSNTGGGNGGYSNDNGGGHNTGNEGPSSNA